MKQNLTAIDQYCRKVRKHLVCSHHTKNNFIEGLKTELLDTVSEVQCFEEIVIAYGTPEMVAANFQEAVSTEEYYQALRTKKVKIIVAYAVTFALILGVAAFALHCIASDQPVYYTSEIQEECTDNER